MFYYKLTESDMTWFDGNFQHPLHAHIMLRVAVMEFDIKEALKGTPIKPVLVPFRRVQFAA